MAFEAGDIKVFNPNKEISKEIVLEILIRHRDSFKQARTGEVIGIPVEKLTDNQRIFNQEKALPLIIASQREMITISRPIIYFKSLQNWKKKYRLDEEQKENPFEAEENEYNTLMDWLFFLKKCQTAILEAKATKCFKDDFMIVKQKTEGDVFELTNNFFDMLDDLEQSYEQIYLLMLTHKIVSAGIEEDEEMTYKEKETEAIRRVVEA